MKILRRTITVKRSMLVSFLAVLILPLVMGMGGYWWAARIVREQATRGFSELLGQARTSVEQAIGEVEGLSKIVTDIQWVQKLGYMVGPTIDPSRLDAWEMSLMSRDVITYSTSRRDIERVALVFNQKDTVISPTGIDTVEWFFDQAWRTDSMDPGGWKRLIGEWTEGTILPPAQMHLYKHTLGALVWIRTLPLLDHTPRVEA